MPCGCLVGLSVWDTGTPGHGIVSDEEMHKLAKDFGCGLRALGAQPQPGDLAADHSGVLMYDDTCAEWMICAQGAMSQVSPSHHLPSLSPCHPYPYYQSCYPCPLPPAAAHVVADSAAAAAA